MLEGDEGPAWDGAADKERWGRSEERDMAKSAGDESNMEHSKVNSSGDLFVDPNTALWFPSVPSYDK